MATIVGWFIALGLAVVGLYALIAHSANRRTSEIGLRMTIGSTRARVPGLVLREGLVVAAAAVALAALVVGLTHAALAGSFYAAVIVSLSRPMRRPTPGYRSRYSPSALSPPRCPPAAPRAPTRWRR